MGLIRTFAGLLFAAVTLTGCPQEQQPQEQRPQASGVPQITVVDARVKLGGPITVYWTSAPANEHAWLGVFKADDPDLEHVLAWEQQIEPNGELVLRPADFRGVLPPGNYTIRLMKADRRTEIASAQVSVFDPEALP